MNKFFKLLSIIIITIFIGCGGSSSNNSSEQTITKTTQMYFIDAPVEGLKYILNDSVTKFTGKNGVIDCNVGDKIGFIIGNTKIGDTILCSSQKQYITPEDIIKDKTKLKNAVALIQSLDEDNNPDNGIIIPQETNILLYHQNINLSNINELNQSLISIGKKLISPETAYNNFLTNLFLIRTNNFNIYNERITAFVNKKIDLINELENKNYKDANITILNMINDYKNFISTINTYKEINESDPLIQKTFELIQEIIIKEIFDIDDDNLKKIINYMNTNNLNQDINFNKIPIDANIAMFLKDLNNSFNSYKLNITINELASIKKTYNYILTNDEYEVAKKFLIFYLTSKDETQFIENVNKFFNTNLKTTDNIISYIANYYGYKVNESNIQNFINTFIKYNENVNKKISDLYKNINAIKEKIANYKTKAEKFFTTDDGKICKEVSSANQIISPILNTSLEVYTNYYGKDSISNVKKVYDMIVDFALDSNGNIYSITNHGNIYKNKVLALKNINAKAIKINNDKIYILTFDGNINVYDKNFNFLYRLNNNILYNKIVISGEVIYALRIDGKIDIYDRDQLIKTLSTSNKNLMYIDEWSSDKYLVCALNNGNIAIFNLFDKDNPSLDGYYQFNPSIATIYNNKMFAVIDKTLYYINLDTKQIVSAFDLNYLTNRRIIALLYTKENELFVKTQSELYLFKLKDNKLVNYLPYLTNNLDPSTTPFPILGYYKNKIFISLYGSIYSANTPINPDINIEGDLINKSLTQSDNNNINEFYLVGNNMTLNTSTSYPTYYNNTINYTTGTYYEKIIYIPVINSAGKLGLYIITPIDNFYISLNSFSGNFLDYNHITYNKNKIVFSNYVENIIYTINPKNVIYHTIIAQRNPKEYSLWNNEASLINISNPQTTDFIDDEGNIYTLSPFSFYYKYSKNRIYIYSHKNDYFGENPQKIDRYKNDLIAYTNGQTEATSQLPSIRICKDFFDKDLTFSQKIENCKLVQSNFVSFNIYDNLLSSNKNIYDLYSFVYGGKLKSLVQIDENINNLIKDGDYYYLLANNKVIILDRNLTKLGTVDLNETFYKIVTKNYFIDNKGLKKISFTNNLILNIKPTAYSPHLTKTYISFDNNNYNNIAYLEVNSSYPYTITLSGDDANYFEVKDNILKIKDISQMNNYMYNIYINVKDVFGNSTQKYIKIFNLEQFTEKNAENVYSKTIKVFERDSSPLDIGNILFFKIIGGDTEYFTQKDGKLYLNPDTPEGVYHLTLIVTNEYVNFELYKYNLTIDVIPISDRYDYNSTVVIDKQENISWTRNTVAEYIYTFNIAQNKCKEYGKGWKLPTIEELKSIANKNTFTGYDLIFNGPGKTTFWSETSCDINKTTKGIYMFDYGSEKEICKPLDQSSLEHKPTNAIRCVKEN